MIAARRPGVEYSVEHADGFFLIYTNDGGAQLPDRARAGGRIPSPANWTDWLPAPRLGVRRRDGRVQALRGGERAVRRAAPAAGDRSPEQQVALRHLPRESVRCVPGRQSGVRHPDLPVQLLLAGDAQSSVYDYDMATRKRELKKRQEIPSGYDRAGTRSSGSWRRRATAPRCRCRCSCGRAPGSTAATRCCSMPTGRTASPSSPRSTPAS